MPDPRRCFRCHHKWNHTGREAKKLPYIDYRQTNKQTHKQTNTQTNKHTNKLFCKKSVKYKPLCEWQLLNPSFYLLFCHFPAKLVNSKYCICLSISLGFEIKILFSNWFSIIMKHFIKMLPLTPVECFGKNTVCIDGDMRV